MSGEASRAAVGKSSRWGLSRAQPLSELLGVNLLGECAVGQLFAAVGGSVEHEHPTVSPHFHPVGEVPA